MDKNNNHSYANNGAAKYDALISQVMLLFTTEDFNSLEDHATPVS